MKAERIVSVGAWIFIMVLGIMSIFVASDMAGNVDTGVFESVEPGTVEASIVGLMGVILFYLIGPMCFLFAFGWEQRWVMDDMKRRIEELEKTIEKQEEVSNDEHEP